GGSATVTITITGSEDVATLTSDSKSLTESDTALSTSGTLTLSGSDANTAALEAQAATAGTYGSVSIDAAGNWTYDTTGALDNLDAGRAAPVPYTALFRSGGSATVTITITGSEDVATLTSDSKSLTESDTALSTSGTLTLS